MAGDDVLLHRVQRKTLPGIAQGGGGVGPSVEIVPGVTSIQAAAARAKPSLAERLGNSRFT